VETPTALTQMLSQEFGAIPVIYITLLMNEDIPVSIQTT